jgi:hypothetical protein
MKAILIFAFHLYLASVCFGDLLEDIQGPAPSRIASIEVGFNNGIGCGGYQVWLILKKANSYQSCQINLGNPDSGETITRDRRSHYNVRNCMLTFDAGVNTPYIRVFTYTNDKFCLANINVRTENNQIFSHNFNNFWAKETSIYANQALTSNTALNNNAIQIANLQCPQNGCPLRNVYTYDVEIPAQYHCSINTNCNFVSSTGISDANNGLICTHSAGSFGLPKYCCTSPTNTGIPHCDDVQPRTTTTTTTTQHPGYNRENQQNQQNYQEIGSNAGNNRNNAQNERLGPYGNPRLPGTSFTLNGPFAKISIKSKHYRHLQATIVQGIKTESINGAIGAFGMDSDDMDGVEELVVPQGQHINGVFLRHGWYIDSIGFFTNTSTQLGPVGGTGGDDSENLTFNQKVLKTIQGQIVNLSQDYRNQAPNIAKLVFTFETQQNDHPGENQRNQ